jgi:hypothetical protein
VDVQTLQRGARTTRQRIWTLCLVVSLVLHLPFTPLAGVFALLGLWNPSATDDEPPDPALTEIPIDVTTDLGGSEDAPPPPPPASEPAGGEPEPAPIVPKPKPKPKPKPIVDAGVPDAAPDAGPQTQDAGISDAGPRDAGAEPPADAAASDAGAGIADRGDAGRSSGDPISDNPAVRSVSDPHPNVRVMVDTEKLRSHRLGARVGALLRGIYQWRDFLGPAGIDPVRDIDRIYIVGPQLRRSANVTVIIQHRLGKERMHEALDRLVQRDPSGGWDETAKVPTARATADNAPRFFVQPSPGIVVVSPPETLASSQRFPLRFLSRLKGQVIAHVYIATPWRAVRGLPFRIPESIEWVSIDIEAGEAGGAVIDIEAQDESVASAAKNSSELTSAVLAATTLNLGVLGDILGQRPRQFVQSVEFDSKGSRILGKITVSEQQVLDALDMASLWLVPPAPRTSGSARSAPTGAGSVRPPTPLR